MPPPHAVLFYGTFTLGTGTKRLTGARLISEVNSRFGAFLSGRLEAFVIATVDRVLGKLTFWLKTKPSSPRLQRPVIERALIDGFPSSTLLHLNRWTGALVGKLPTRFKDLSNHNDGTHQHFALVGKVGDDEYVACNTKYAWNETRRRASRKFEATTLREAAKASTAKIGSARVGPAKAGGASKTAAVEAGTAEVAAPLLAKMPVPVGPVDVRRRGRRVAPSSCGAGTSFENLLLTGTGSGAAATLPPLAPVVFAKKRKRNQHDNASAQAVGVAVEGRSPSLLARRSKRNRVELFPYTPS